MRETVRYGLNVVRGDGGSFLEVSETFGQANMLAIALAPTLAPDTSLDIMRVTRRSEFDVSFQLVKRIAG